MLTFASVFPSVASCSARYSYRTSRDPRSCFHSSPADFPPRCSSRRLTHAGFDSSSPPGEPNWPITTTPLARFDFAAFPLLSGLLKVVLPALPCSYHAPTASSQVKNASSSPVGLPLRFRSQSTSRSPANAPLTGFSQTIFAALDAFNIGANDVRAAVALLGTGPDLASRWPTRSRLRFRRDPSR